MVNGQWEDTQSMTICFLLKCWHSPRDVTGLILICLHTNYSFWGGMHEYIDYISLFQLWPGQYHLIHSLQAVRIHACTQLGSPANRGLGGAPPTEGGGGGAGNPPGGGGGAGSPPGGGPKSGATPGGGWNTPTQQMKATQDRHTQLSAQEACISC